MAIDALRFIAVVALAATISGCGCSGDDGGRQPGDAEDQKRTDESVDRMRDEEYQARLDGLRNRRDKAMKRVHAAKRELDHAIAAGAGPRALAVYSNSLENAVADMTKVRDEAQRVVSERIVRENAQRKKLNEKDSEKRDGGKNK